jgi:hypothetical protein
MPFTIADDVSSISANKLIKKYQTLKKLCHSAISHVTGAEINGKREVISFVIMTGSIHNKHAIGLYNTIVENFPIVNDANRKQVIKELDAAIELANKLLPMEKDARVYAAKA